MPRTLPGAFTAKIGQSNSFFVWLVELRLASGTKYFSRGVSVTYNGHTWVPRLLGIDSLVAAYIDAKNKDFATPTFRFSNLSDDGSTNFYFTGLDSAESFANREVRVHLYDVDSGTAIVDFWAGYLESPTYSNDGSEMTIGANFVWGVLDITAPKIRVMRKCQYAFFNETWDGNDSLGCPYHTFGTPGFTSCAKSKQDCSARGMTRFYSGWTQAGLDPAKRGREDIRKAAVPIVLGAGVFKIKPQIYLVRVVGNELWVNFIISGTNPSQPFDAGDIDENRVTIFGSTQATKVDLKYGAYPESLPANSDRFPDGLGHSLVCQGLAIFALTNEQKDNLDVEHLDFKIGLNNGRKIKTTGVPSGNPALQLRDFIQDKVYSLGLPDSALNTTIQAGTQAYVATRWQTRYVLKEQARLIDTLQRMLGDFHGFITFDNAQLAIGCKRNDSTPVATFGTGGRMILNNYVKAYEKKEDDLKNQVLLNYRDQKYRPQAFLYYDKAAQQSAGNGIEKIIPEEFESLGLYDPAGDATQIGVNLAIYLREILNGNLFIEFDVALNDGIDVLPGEIIRVNNARIPNNATNNFLFRVLPYKIDEANYKITFTCQIYKSIFYDYTADPIGSDVIRTTDDTTSQGRAPDVTPFSVQILAVGANDGEGKMAKIRATFTLPAFDPTTEQSDGVFRPSPIQEVDCVYSYDDEVTNQVHFGETRKVVQTTSAQTLYIDFNVDYRKTRTLIIYFLSIGPNRGRAPIGYIPDRTKASSLPGNLPINIGAGFVNSITPFAVGDYTIIDREINKIASLTAGSPPTMTWVVDGGLNRVAFFDTASIAHSLGTEIAVAKPSYPSISFSLSSPRFNYSPVTGLTVRQRGDGVKVEFADPNADNQEKFYIYISTIASAGTDVALLGSTNPTWYASDPENPPVGISLIKTGGLGHKIAQETLGAAGTNVFVRVAARNGKRNFSSALSGLASNSSTGDTMPATAPPNNGTQLSQPTVKLKKKGLIINGEVNYPQVNPAVHLWNVVQIHDNNATGGGRKFFDPTTGTWVSTYTDPVNNGTTEIKCGLNGHVVIPANAVDLFVGGRTTIYVRFGIRNTFGGGSTTYSGDLAASFTQAGSDADPLAGDTTTPGSLNTPSIKFRRGKLRCQVSLQGSTNLVTIRLTEIAVCNNAGTNSLNISDLDSTTAVAGVVFYPLSKTDPKDNIPVSKQQLQAIFGETEQLKCQFRFTNDNGVVTSPFSGLTNPLDQLKDYSPRVDDDQELWNGDFTNNNDDETGSGGDVNSLGNWTIYNPFTGDPNGTPTTTNNLMAWDKDRQLVFWKRNNSTGNKRVLVQNLYRTLIRGDFHSFSLFLSSNSSLNADVEILLAALFDLTGTIAITNGSKNFVGTGTAFLTELKVGAEVGVNNEVHRILTITDDTHGQFVENALSTASSQTCHAAVQQSDIVTVGNRTYGTAQTYAEGVFQIVADAFLDRDIFFYIRTPTVIVNAGPFLQVQRVKMNAGKTPTMFSRKTLKERNRYPAGLSGGLPISSESLSVIPGTTVGGFKQDPSGDTPGVGGILVF